MILAGFTRDLTITAPRRSDKPTPWVNTAVIRSDQQLWLDDGAFIELREKHGGAVCDVTPNFSSMVWGWTTPLRISALRVVDCPTCKAGTERRITLCPLCKGATRLFNL